jgi:hypothetical protein
VRVTTAGTDGGDLGAGVALPRGIAAHLFVVAAS